MLNSPRWLLALVSVSFAVFHAVLGALSWKDFDNEYLLFASIGIYLAAISLVVFTKPGISVGSVFGALAAIGGVSTAVVANLGITDGRTGTYASWYVGGMGVLFGILAIRGQARLAWMAGLLVAVVVVQAAGFGAIGPSGLVGMVVLIAAGQATARSLARADREVAALQETELATESAIVSAAAAASVRRTRLREVLRKALPELSFITANGGRLTPEHRTRLLQLEASLRDDIRGRNLLNERVRLAVQDAREKGVQVLLLDEGGLDAADPELMSALLDQVADAIASVATGKIVIRAPRGEEWMVTVMATRPGTSSPDIWLKL